MIINNRKYNGSCINDFIIVDEKIVLPETLCKYYKLTDFSIDSIVNSYFYLNHPVEFNDPYDSLRMLSIQGEDAFSKYQLLLMYLGIVCFSENSDSMLMWAHYSGHNGFLINFKTKQIKNIFYSINPINYVIKLPKINRESDGVALMISTNIKSSLWSYEKEWRCIYHTKKPMRFPSSNQSLVDFEKRLFKRKNIKLEERKLKYDVNAIDYVTIGYKLITEEEYQADIETGYLKFNLSSKNKCKLINFLIDNNIPTRMTDLGKTDGFEIINRPIKITRCKSRKFKYKLKISL